MLEQGQSVKIGMQSTDNLLKWYRKERYIYLDKADRAIYQKDEVARRYATAMADHYLKLIDGIKNV